MLKQSRRKKRMLISILLCKKPLLQLLFMLLLKKKKMKGRVVLPLCCHNTMTAKRRIDWWAWSECLQRKRSKKKERDREQVAFTSTKHYCPEDIFR